MLKSAVLIVITLLVATLTIVLLPFNRKGRAFHWCARFWGRLVLKITPIRVKTKGLEHLQFGVNYIYAANHASYFDIPTLVAVLPGQIRIVFKKELTRLPIFGWAMKLGSYISIDRGDSREAVESLEKAAGEIREGSSVLLFPEGTRTQDGRIQPFKRGAFTLAARSRVPIVPVTVNGSFSILPKRGLRINSGNVEVIIHPPVLTNGCTGKEGEMQLMKRVRDIVASDYVEPGVSQMGPTRDHAFEQQRRAVWP
jgi:1-acyl-sn-glycerol-3-phosphate acyltransferase